MIEEMPDRVIADLDPAPVQFRQQLASGQVRFFFDTGTDPVFFAGQSERFLAAHRQRRRATGLLLASGPADRRGMADLIVRRGPGATHAARHGGDNPFAKIERIRSSHAGWPPLQPAS